MQFCGIQAHKKQPPRSQLRRYCPSIPPVTWPSTDQEAGIDDDLSKAFSAQLKLSCHFPLSALAFSLFALILLGLPGCPSLPATPHSALRGHPSRAADSSSFCYSLCKVSIPHACTISQTFRVDGNSFLASKHNVVSFSSCVSYSSLLRGLQKA